MKTAFLIFMLAASTCFSQFDSYFQNVQEQFPSMPSGVLESVAYNNTRMSVLTSEEEVSCSAMPIPFGLLGLFDNGGDYFIPNAKIIERLSGISISAQKQSIEKELTAYATAFSILWKEDLHKLKNSNEENRLYRVFCKLSEIPDSGNINAIARDIQIEQYLSFLTSLENSKRFGFTLRSFDLTSVFGTENLEILHSKRLIVQAGNIRNEKGKKYLKGQQSQSKSLQYAPALWNPAPSCNFSSRNGIPVSAITIHTVQGSYAGAISWAQNCNSNVSYHYVVRSSDGQITQLVHEEDKAWHVGSENPYTIGYEHEGYVSNPAWYTEAMYLNSADLSRDIINSGYGINPLRTYDGPASSAGAVLGGCIKVKGHQHYPNQTHTDPGINWNWEKYYRLINDAPIPTQLLNNTGNIYDTGGESANYQNDERTLWLIQPPAAEQISLQFTSFDLEQSYDRLYIYDGNNIDAPLLGMYTGNTLPNAILSSGGSLLLEFRSDCGNTASGWIAHYQSELNDTTIPTTTILPDSNWKSQNFSAAIMDLDEGNNLLSGFYLAADRPSPELDFQSNGERGFAFDNFTNSLSEWTIALGNYEIANEELHCIDINVSNSNAYTLVEQNGQHAYVLEWTQRFTSTSTNQRAGMHFFCSDPNLPNRGNSYFVYLREEQNTVQVYSVENDVYTLRAEQPVDLVPLATYLVQVYFSPETGNIVVWINNQHMVSWVDSSPLQSGIALSLRSAGGAVAFDNVRCYKSRQGNVNISLQEDMRFQSMAENTAGKLLAFSVDSAWNVSEMSEQYYRLDWTQPEISFIIDGMVVDQDSTANSTLFSSWSVSDPHSGMDSVEFAIGTQPYWNDELDWLPCSNLTNYWYALPNPIPGQTYFSSVTTSNKAGLENSQCSDGIMYDPMSSLHPPSADSPLPLIVNNPIRQELTIQRTEPGDDILLYDPTGRLIKRYICAQFGVFSEPLALSKGIYNLLILRKKNLIYQHPIYAE